jgi:hypothetical protein
MQRKPSGSGSVRGDDQVANRMRQPIVLFQSPDERGQRINGRVAEQYCLREQLQILDYELLIVICGLGIGKGVIPVIRFRDIFQCLLTLLRERGLKVNLISIFNPVTFLSKSAFSASPGQFQSPAFQQRQDAPLLETLLPAQETVNSARSGR